MHGFVSFVLVFACVAIILLILSSGTGTNHSTQIGLKKLHSLEMDIKNTLLDLAKAGATKAAREYVYEKIIGSGKPWAPSVSDIDEIKKRARNAGHAEMKKLADLLGADEAKEFKIQIWCGYTNDAEMAIVRDTMFRERAIRMCSECLEIKNDECAGFIDVEIKGIGTENPLDAYAEIGFWRSLGGMSTGVIGISVYSEKFNVAGVSYVPVSEIR